MYPTEQQLSQGRKQQTRPADDKVLYLQKVEAVISRCCLDVLTSPLTRSSSPISSRQRLCCASLNFSSSANGLNPTTAASLHLSPVIKEISLLSGNCKIETNHNDKKNETEKSIYIFHQWVDSSCHIIKFTSSRKWQTYIGWSPLSLWTGHFSSKDSL